MTESFPIPNEPLGQYPGLVAAYGLVPNLFRAQCELPRVIEAEERLVDAILVRENVLSRLQKENILHRVASVWGNGYCEAIHRQSPRVVSEKESALLQFAGKLARQAPWCSEKDVQGLRDRGFEDAAILESVITTALGRFLCTLADALHPHLDTGFAAPDPSEPLPLLETPDWVETSGPYFQPETHTTEDFPHNSFFREHYGFVPNLFRVQTLLPDVLKAEVGALESVLLPEDHLSRIQKESILLAISGANLNTYWVSVQGQVLSTLGVPPEESDQLVENHREPGIEGADIVLLNEVRKLAHPILPQEAEFEPDNLRAQGFSQAQIIETVTMSALANFLNTLQSGLGPICDFPPRHVFTSKDLYRFSGQARPTSVATFPDDPDAEVVTRVQSGDVDAFEDLVRRHTRRVMATLAGILGNMDDARDATQDVFLKAFEHIDRFQRRSKFSTWLMSIAINTGTEILRQRKPSDPWETFEDEESFRPRQLQSWTDDPEQQVAAAQRCGLVREGVLRLPEKYRVAVLLRDISQLSTEEAAAAMGLSVPALKARVLRGRLMLRESLAPYFIRAERRADAQLR